MPGEWGGMSREGVMREEKCTNCPELRQYMNPMGTGPRGSLPSLPAPKTLWLQGNEASGVLSPSGCSWWPCGWFYSDTCN